MRSRVAVEVVRVDEPPVGQAGRRRLMVRWSDGAASEAARFYADEWLMSEGDLVGKTEDEIRSLAHDRDVDYLRDGSADVGDMPFFYPG